MATEQERNTFISDKVMPTYADLQKRVEELEEAVESLKAEVELARKGVDEIYTVTTNPDTGLIETEPKEAKKKDKPE
jgi:archaellum component FlaC